MSAEEVFGRFLKTVKLKELNLEGYTTIRQQRKIVIPLRGKGVDVEATVEAFLTELLASAKNKNFRGFDEAKK